MIIGIDLDGVVFDSERLMKVYASLYDIEHNDRGVIKKDELYIGKRYQWDKSMTMDFLQRNVQTIQKDAPLMAGAKVVLDKLIKEGHKLYIISRRGTFFDDEITITQGLMKKYDINIPVYYKQDSKLQTCKELGIELMIDDYFQVMEELSSNNIDCLYFRDVNIKKLPDSKYIHEVTNWGEIYKYIYDKTK